MSPRETSDECEARDRDEPKRECALCGVTHVGPSAALLLERNVAYLKAIASRPAVAAEDERGAFEKWARGHYCSLNVDSWNLTYYGDRATAAAWAAWQARAAAKGGGK